MKRTLILALAIFTLPVFAQECNYRICVNQKFTGSHSNTESVVSLRPAQVALVQEQLPPGYSLRPIIMPRPTFGGVPGESSYRTLANKLHELDITGIGTKVGIIDIGFKGITGVAAGDVSSFNNTLNITGLNFDYSQHGTACLEVIREIVPDAEIFVYRLGGANTESSIAQQMIADDIDIACSSLAWLGYPESGPACDAARTLITAGIPWINAAGNWADGEYWEAQSATLDSNNYLQFGTSNLNHLTSLSRGVEIGFSFEAPDSSYARYRAELLENTGNGFTVVATSNDEYFFQYFSYYPVAGANYALRIQQTQTGTAGRMRVQTFINKLSVSVSEGSISNPGTLADVITVGAVHQSDYSEFGSTTSYSSRGGGVWNVQLDACAPTSCQTISYNGAFVGTSCSAPGLAGLMLLMIQQGITPENAFSALEFKDIMQAGYDNESGAGIALAPLILTGLPYFTSPRRTYFPTSQVGTIISNAISANSIIIQYSIISGNLPSGLSLDPSSGSITGTLTQAGEYTFTVQITDFDNDTNQCQYTWSVIPAGLLHIAQPAPMFLHSIQYGEYSLFSFNADNPTGTAIWMHASGRIPPGLVLDANTGELSGLPTIAGEYDFTLRVTDSESQTSERHFVLSVDGPSPLVEPTTGFVGCTVNTAPTWSTLMMLLLITALRGQKRKRARQL
ncbi:MAG: putative Ig domain-containing protein [Planctomycetes bacterium]|nr:putative Ig domain-containing protein [Planctomycetota bacterium]